LLAITQTSQNFPKKYFFFTKLKRKIIELTEKTWWPSVKIFKKQIYRRRQYVNIPLSCKFTAGGNVTQPLSCKFTAGGHA
jgi:hypothetical protein